MCVDEANYKVEQAVNTLVEFGLDKTELQSMVERHRCQSSMLELYNQLLFLDTANKLSEHERDILDRIDWLLRHSWGYLSKDKERSKGGSSRDASRLFERNNLEDVISECQDDAQ